MIKFLSKSEKFATRLRDGLRVIAWEQFKLDNQLSGDKAFDGYEGFKQEWNDHEVHSMSYAELVDFIDQLEYTEEEILNMRSAYYERKSRFDNGGMGSRNEEEPQSTESKSEVPLEAPVF